MNYAQVVPRYIRVTNKGWIWVVEVTNDRLNKLYWSLRVRGADRYMKYSHISFVLTCTKIPVIRKNRIFFLFFTFSRSAWFRKYSCKRICSDLKNWRSYRRLKRVFFESVFFDLADGISRVLINRLTRNLEEIFTGYTFIAWIMDFKIWLGFIIFFTSQTIKKAKKIDI